MILNVYKSNEQYLMLKTHNVVNALVIAIEKRREKQEKKHFILHTNKRI